MPQLPSRVSKSDLASLLDVGGRHLQKLGARGVVVRAEEGGYDLASSVRGYLKHVTADAERRAGSATEDGLRSAKAAALQARLSREDRNLITIEEARETLSKIVDVFLEALAAMPADLGRSGDARLIEIIDNAEVALRRKLKEQMAKLEGGR